jgi:hypothetical protein
VVVVSMEVTPSLFWHNESPLLWGRFDLHRNCGLAGLFCQICDERPRNSSAHNANTVARNPGSVPLYAESHVLGDHFRSPRPRSPSSKYACNRFCSNLVASHTSFCAFLRRASPDQGVWQRVPCLSFECPALDSPLYSLEMIVSSIGSTGNTLTVSYHHCLVRGNSTRRRSAGRNAQEMIVKTSITAEGTSSGS